MIIFPDDSIMSRCSQWVNAQLGGTLGHSICGERDPDAPLYPLWVWVFGEAHMLDARLKSAERLLCHADAAILKHLRALKDPHHLEGICARMIHRQQRRLLDCQDYQRPYIQWRIDAACEVLFCAKE